MSASQVLNPPAY